MTTTNVFVIAGLAAALTVESVAAQQPAASAGATDSVASAVTPPDVVPPEVAPPDILPPGAFAMGPRDAAVTIEEYTDYLCGFCRDFEDQVARPLREKYAGPEGTVRWITRIHPIVARSWDGAVAAWCASRQSRFWEMHDLLFERVGDWSDTRRTGSVFLEVAGERGLDAEEFKACLADPRSRSVVVEAYRSEYPDRLTCGTPVLFINGMVVPRTEKYYSFEGLESVILGEHEVRQGVSECRAVGTQEIPFEPTRVSEPALLNADDVVDAILRQYPEDLREAGIRGAVTLWLFVDPSGRVQDTQVVQSSSYAALDAAAARVAREMRFEPARTAGEPVGVWVAQRFDFTF